VSFEQTRVNNRSKRLPARANLINGRRAMSTALAVGAASLSVMAALPSNLRAQQMLRPQRMVKASVSPEIKPTHTRTTPSKVESSIKEFIRVKLLHSRPVDLGKLVIDLQGDSISDKAVDLTGKCFRKTPLSPGVKSLDLYPTSSSTFNLDQSNCFKLSKHGAPIDVAGHSRERSADQTAPHNFSLTNEAALLAAQILFTAKVPVAKVAQLEGVSAANNDTATIHFGRGDEPDGRYAKDVTIDENPGGDSISDHITWYDSVSPSVESVRIR
jgi:hypothetical protein